MMATSGMRTLVSASDYQLTTRYPVVCNISNPSPNHSLTAHFLLFTPSSDKLCFFLGLSVVYLTYGASLVRWHHAEVGEVCAVA
jgi:hypothetical protein